MIEFVSTNSRNTKTTTFATCRRQIVKMVSRSLFLFPVSKRHFVFFYGDHYLSVSDIRPIDWSPTKCTYSRWNFANMLFPSEAISVSGLQAPYCFYPVIIICLGRAYILWIGRPRKCRNSRWNFTNILLLSEGILFPVYKRHFVFNGDHYLSV